MSWNPALTIITVYGTIQLTDGSSKPASGHITFTSEFPLTDSVGNIVSSPVNLTATLDTTGSFSIELPATDDPDISPAGWTYRAVMATTAYNDDFEFVLPYTTPGGTQAWAAIVPVLNPPAPTGTYAPYSEIAARMAADAVLQGEIDNEIADREAADNVLQGEIDSEVTARIAADNVLQGEIDDLTDHALPAIVVSVGDDIQVAIDTVATAGGGIVWLAPGTHTHAGLTMRSQVILDGGTAEATSLVLAAGSDVSCITTEDFATLTGSGAHGANDSGPHGWAIRNITIVGDQTNQAGTSWGIQAYGYDYTLDGVYIRDCLSGGLYTEWGDFGLGGATTPGMEARISGLRIHHNGGVGWHHRGPHDSHAYDVIVWENAGYGVWADSLDGVYSANGTILTGVHVHGSLHTWAMVWDGQIHAQGCQAEGASVGQVWIRYGDCTWTGGQIYDVAPGGGAGLGLRLGDTSGAVTATGARVDTILTGWRGSSAATAAIDLQETAQCELMVRVWMTTPAGTAINGAPDATDTLIVTVHGAGMSTATAAARSRVILRGSTTQDVGSAAQAWLLQSGATDVLNINTSSGRVELLGGRQVWLYSDAFYSSPAIKLDGAAGHIAVTSTTLPGAVPGAALGAGAPAIVVDGESCDQRGLLGFGTGTGAFPGAAIVVTFAAAFPRTPQVVLQARNGSTQALGVFPSSVSPNGFTVELGFDPADSQPAGTYYVSYVVMG